MNNRKKLSERLSRHTFPLASYTIPESQYWSQFRTERNNGRGNMRNGIMREGGNDIMQSSHLADRVIRLTVTFTVVYTYCSQLFVYVHIVVMAWSERCTPVVCPTTRGPRAPVTIIRFIARTTMVQQVRAQSFAGSLAGSVVYPSALPAIAHYHDCDRQLHPIQFFFLNEHYLFILHRFHEDYRMIFQLVVTCRFKQDNLKR